MIRSLIRSLITSGIRQALRDDDPERGYHDGGREPTQDEPLLEWAADRDVFADYRLAEPTFLRLPDGSWGVCVPDVWWPPDGSWETTAPTTVERDVHREDGTVSTQRLTMLFTLDRDDGRSVAVCEIGRAPAPAQEGEAP